ncbi:MAG: hypothetical protein QM627_06975 [Luteolibacter sp.]
MLPEILLAIGPIGVHSQLENTKLQRLNFTFQGSDGGREITAPPPLEEPLDFSSLSPGSPSMSGIRSPSPLRGVEWRAGACGSGLAVAAEVVEGFGISAAATLVDAVLSGGADFFGAAVFWTTTALGAQDAKGKTAPKRAEMSSCRLTNGGFLA